MAVTIARRQNRARRRDWCAMKRCDVAMTREVATTREAATSYASDDGAKWCERK
jgi:hypothetical protein